MIELAGLLMIGDILAQSSPQASDAPQSVPSAQNAPESDPVTRVDDVVVTGRMTDVSNRIDRRVYAVRDDPELQAASLLDILAKIPSVSVTPGGRVSLLGTPNVTVLVDGKPLADPQGYLRSVPGSRLDRVEVMTNPPAEFSAQGTGGVINIITRRSLLPGLTGTANVGVITTGTTNLTVSPNWSVGRWSASGTLRLSNDRPESRTRRTRDFLDAAGEVDERSLDIGNTRSNDKNFGLESSLSFAATEHDRLTLGVELGRSDGSVKSRSTVDFAQGEDFDQMSTNISNFDVDKFTLGYERTGPRDGESLTTDLSWSGLDYGSEYRIKQDYAVSPRAETLITTLWRHTDTNASIKYQRHFGEDKEVSFGAAFDRSDRRADQAIQSLAGTPVGPDTASTLSGRRDVASAFATAQFPLRRWTVLPGVRVEQDEFDVSSSQAVAQGDRTDIFPSLFLRRKLSDAKTLNLSYSRRINRPDLVALDPFVTYSSPTQASSGNPELSPEFTDSFEARLEHRGETRTATLTLYSRRTTDSINQVVQRLEDGVTLSRPINVGVQSNRGAELSFQQRLFSRGKVVLTGNLFNRSRSASPVFDISSDDAWSYSASAVIEYKGGDQDTRPGDTYQATLRYFGPTQNLQTRSRDYVRLDLVWRRPVTAKTAWIFSVSDVFDTTRYRSTLDAATVREWTESNSPAPTFRIALSRRFGADQ